jgi:hypothetical protein|tara:strand:+ start:18050 stop:18532 length:483 start_codon:yes stop_codon:yes gene_type:complete
MNKIIFLIGFLISGSFCFSQTIIRSSINCVGNSANTEHITVQQTVGQSYQTGAYYSNEIESRPGFIQPSQLWVELIQNTFKVKMTVYPNPAVTTVDFKLNENLENIVLRVIDANGRMIYIEKIESLREYTLNCAPWTAGNYFIYITDKSGNIYQSKLIKR